MVKVSVKNGGKSRKGEVRKNPRAKESKNRCSGSRKLETIKRKEDRGAKNIELGNAGLYKCQRCEQENPESLFPQHVPSGKFSRFETCKQCLDTKKEQRIISGVIQNNTDRNATRCLQWQRVMKATLKGRPGYDEFTAECDAANPAKPERKTRHTKEEMVEKLPLVNHGLVELHIFTLFFLTCLVVAGVAQEELMKCVNVSEPMKKLHVEMGGTEHFSQSAVAADLVQIEQHLLAELPVSLRVKESPFSDISGLTRATSQ